MLLLSGCDPEPLADGGPPVDAGPDANVSGDAGGDAGSDAGVSLDGAGVDSAIFDSGLADGGVADAGSFCLCEMPPECLMAFCSGATCVHAPAPDGSACGPSGTRFCIDGVCSVGSCGDGFRAPGPDPAREACDDGNSDDSDACDSTCTPRVFVIASEPGLSSWPTGPSAAASADGTGRVLVVWSEERSPPAGEPRVAVRARMYSGTGVPVGVPMDVEPNIGLGWDASPTVAGLPAGGWVVAWRSPYIEGALGDLGGIAYVLVGSSGRTGRTERANVDVRGDQLAPSVAALSAGFVVAWEDRSLLVPSDPGYAVLARIFDAAGAPTTLPMAIATSSAGDQTAPALASNGDDWVVAWTDGGGLADPSVRLRRYRMAMALDDADIDIAPGMRPSLSMTPASVLVAWESRADDVRGDVYATTLAAGAKGIGVVARHGAVGSSDASPRIVSAPGGGHALVWQAGWRRGVELRVATPSAPPELSLLTPELMPGLQGDVSLFSAPDGLWVIWSDDGPHGVPAALRSTLGFLLPWD